jgi:RNA polymerase sigma-70 factor (ECF subfamily)
MSRNAELLSFQYPEILRFIRRRINSESSAEDVAQEAFASAAQALGHSSDAAPPNLAWLYTVARRRLIDEARRRRRFATAPLELVEEVAAREDEYGGLVAHVLENSLALLSAPQRAVVVMRLLEGRSFAEIAARLGATEDACRMRFMRALQQLRAQFEKEGLAP